MFFFSLRLFRDQHALISLIEVIEKAVTSRNQRLYVNDDRTARRDDLFYPVAYGFRIRPAT